MFIKHVIDFLINSGEQKPFAYNWRQLKWAISIDMEGQFHGILELGNGKKGKSFLVPDLGKGRTSKIISGLISDRADYVLGITNGASNPENVTKKHMAFIEYQKYCFSKTENPLVKAIVDFYKNIEGEDISIISPLTEEILDRDRMTFVIDGFFPFEEEEIQRFWRNERLQAMNRQDQDGISNPPESTCPVCGKKAKSASKHFSTVMGIPGAPLQGCSALSSHTDALWSYGMRDSCNLGICAQCGKNYISGLNLLLSKKENHFFISDPTPAGKKSKTTGQKGAAIVFWTKEKESDFGLLDSLCNPSPTEVKKMFNSVWGGARPGSPDENDFFLATLTSSSARVSVTGWEKKKIRDIQQSIRTWFKTQDKYGVRLLNNGKYEGLYKFAGAHCSKKNKATVSDVRNMVYSAIAGKPIPENSLRQCVERCLIEKDVSAVRAAFIGLYFELEGTSGQKKRKIDTQMYALEILDC